MTRHSLHLFLIVLLQSALAWSPSAENSVTSAAATAVTMNRRNLLTSALAAASSLALVTPFSPASAAEDNDDKTVVPPTIVACTVSSDGSPANCVSTSSVRQLDLYMVPWTYPSDMSTPEVVARLKGLVQSDPSLSLRGDGETWVSATASRNFGTCVDQLDFVVRPDDHVITFQSKQLPSLSSSSSSDFGANRKRLEELRLKAGGVFGRMGEAMETADTSVREGVGGQLKAFWGLQSGTGYEDVVLE